MPVQLPCKDVWHLYRTVVLKYPLTRDEKCDKMSMLFTTRHGHKLTAKELLFWHNRGQTCEL